MKWHGTMSFVIFLFHVLASYKNDLCPTLQKNMENYFFSLVLVQINKIYYMLYFVLYHYYFLVEVYLYQHDISLTYEYVLSN